MARLCDAWAREGPRTSRTPWEAGFAATPPPRRIRVVFRGRRGASQLAVPVAIRKEPPRAGGARGGGGGEEALNAAFDGENILGSSAEASPVSSSTPSSSGRSFRQVRSTPRRTRFVCSTSLNSALVFGSIFWKMGLTQSSIQDRLGLLQVSAINAAMAALMKTISAFTSEKVVVDRERASGWYDAAPYLLAKLVAELPAGAFFPLAFGAVVYPMTERTPKK